MKIKTLQKHRILLVVILLYITLGSMIVYMQYQYITNYQYQSMGKNALNLAEMAAKSLHVTNADVEALEDMTFEESQQYPINQQLEQLFQLIQKNDSIKYAYVLRKLPENKIKYKVIEEDQKFYGLPTGTKLDYIWLLDVIVDENQQKEVNNTPDYYKDKNRYTTNSEDIASALENRKIEYLLEEDEWGTQISGVVPIYTTEGDYIGILGIDMYSNSFFAYRSKIFWTLLLLVLVPTLFLSGGYIFMHVKYRKKMNNLAYKDQLTGVYNRRYFDVEGKKIIEQAYKNQMPIGIIIGDIDDFKRFNDCYGHQEGDTALQAVAAIMCRTILGYQGFLARYGGEEFVLLSCSKSALPDLCQTICTNVEEKTVRSINGRSTHITISLGAYVKVPAETDSLEKFVKQADEALYQAKREGKNRYIIKDQSQE